LADIARQKIREAEAKLADRRIVAPFDGWVGLRRISAGALVSPGTVITSIDKLDIVKLDFGIPETVLGSVGEGAEIVATTESLRNRQFKGRIKDLDMRIDPVTRSIDARAEVANPDLALRPGMLVMIELRLEPRHSLSIPERALVPMGSKSMFSSWQAIPLRRSPSWWKSRRDVANRARWRCSKDCRKARAWSRTGWSVCWTARRSGSAANTRARWPP